MVAGCSPGDMCSRFCKACGTEVPVRMFFVNSGVVQHYTLQHAELRVFEFDCVQRKSIWNHLAYLSDPGVCSDVSRQFLRLRQRY